MLSPTDLVVPKHQVTIDRREALYYLALKKEMLAIKSDEDARKYRARHAEELGGYPFTLREAQQFRVYADFIVDQFHGRGSGSGRVLTPPEPLMGIDVVVPRSPDVYTKPILLLINELDFSGADFFPAILQDAGRARLMGVNTAGAGGYIVQMSYFNPFGIAGFYITASLALRPGGRPIENDGVRPHLKYGLSTTDLQDEYCELIDHVNSAVADLVAGRPVAGEPV